MKKLILSLGLFAGVVSAASAQEASFGIKAGVGLASITGSDVTSSGKKNLVVPTAGVMADISFSDLISFHPELLYSQKGVRYENGASYAQTRLSYLDLPLLLRIKAEGLFFEAGPQLGFLIAEKDEINVSGLGSTTSTSTDGTRKVDIGYIAGVGYHLPAGLEFGIRYNGGISDLNDENTGGSKIRNSVFQFQVGYLFGGK